MSLTTFVAAAAATLMPPAPTAPLFTADDWTKEGILEQKSVTVVLATVHVSSDGQPISCKVLYSNAVGSMTDNVCRFAMNRGTFVPAVGAHGEPIDGLYRHRLVFRNPNLNRGARTAVTWIPLFALKLAQWPQDLPTGPAEAVTIVAQVEANGGMSACSPGKATGSEALSKIACDYINSQRETLPTVSRDGKTFAYVSEFTVQFDLLEPTKTSVGASAEAY